MLFLGAWGEDDSLKKPEAKNLVICNVHKVALRSIKVRSALLYCCVLFSIYWLGRINQFPVKPAKSVCSGAEVLKKLSLTKPADLFCQVNK